MKWQAAFLQGRSKISRCALKLYPVSVAGWREGVQEQHHSFWLYWSSLQAKSERPQAAGSPSGCAWDAPQQVMCWSLHRDIHCGASSGPREPLGVGVCKQTSRCASLWAALCCAGTGVILPISCLRISSAGSQLFHPSIAQLCALPCCPQLSCLRDNWPALDGRVPSISSSVGLKKMAGTLEERDAETSDTVVHNKQDSNFS